MRVARTLFHALDAVELLPHGVAEAIEETVSDEADVATSQLLRRGREGDLEAANDPKAPPGRACDREKRRRTSGTWSSRRCCRRRSRTVPLLRFLPDLAFSFTCPTLPVGVCCVSCPIKGAY